jgi:chitin disaccharide deacetylase
MNPIKERCLIVNADDFGMSHGITDGILLAHREGFLTSASLMTNMPAADYAVKCLAQAPALGVGVHLNICSGRPLLPPESIPTLVDAEGTFHPSHTMIRKLWRWQVSGREIESEFRAQLRWAKDRGIIPTHADSHHHMNLYPAAAVPFVRALAAEGIAHTRSPRCGVWPRQQTFGGPHEGCVARRTLVQAYRMALRSTIFRRLAMPDSRVSFLHSGRRDLARLGDKWKEMFKHLPAGLFELACHPGVFERGFSETDRIHVQREEELRCLTSRELLDAVMRSGIRLVTYEALARTRAPQQAAAEAPAL